MCATVFYRRMIKGRLYPRAARTGPYAYAQEVTRVGGRVVTKYVGIAKVSEGQDRTERGETETEDVIEKPEGTPDGDNTGQPP